MNPKVIVQPAAEPITLEEARLHCRVEAYGSPATHPEDPLLQVFITAAREWVENYTATALCPQTLEIALDEFPDGPIEITRGPVRAITSVKYADSDQAVQTVADDLYTLDTYSDRIWLIPAVGTTWPAAGEFANAVKIRWEAGYDIPGSSPLVEQLPSSVKIAMLLLIGHLYKNREGTVDKALTEVPLGVTSWLAQSMARQGFA